MRYERAFKEAWTESIPAPLVMTDKEILDFMDEYCESVELEGNGWKVAGWGFSVKANLLRPAVCLAAAYHKEVNR